MKAIWKNKVIAESSDTLAVEGNHYFPRESLVEEFFTPSDHQTTCPWKGVANYMNIVVDGEVNENAAWTYPSTKPDAKRIEGRVAFWKGVKTN